MRAIGHEKGSAASWAPDRSADRGLPWRRRGTARLLTADQARTPGTAGAAPAAGPQARRGRGPLRVPAAADDPEVAPGFRRATPPVRKEPFLEMPELGRSMVLTFDDGPDPRYTPDILEHPARARRARDVLRLRRDGRRQPGPAAGDGRRRHIVGNHTWSHPLMPRTRASGDPRPRWERTSEVIERTPRHAAALVPRALRGLEPAVLRDRRRARHGATGLDRRHARLDDTGHPHDRPSGSWRAPAPGVVVLSHDAGGDRSQSVAALRGYLPRTAGGRLQRHRAATAVRDEAAGLRRSNQRGQRVLTRRAKTTTLPS